MTKYKIPFKNIHRIMKENTTQRIKKESVYQTILFYETLTKEITKYAEIYSKHDHRTTINDKDIQLAIKTIWNSRLE